MLLDRDLAEMYGVETKRLNEQGVAMLSSVLNGERAVQVNIAIRQMMQPEDKGRKSIGFKVKEDNAAYL